MQANRAITPPGGWHFPDGAVTFRGDTHQQLIDKIVANRVVQSQPAGDPLAEVDQYICTRWPTFCVGQHPKQPRVQGSPADNHVPDDDNLFAFAAGRLTQLWERNVKPDVSQDVARSRAIICSTCPQNVNAVCKSCRNVSEHVRRLVTYVRRSRQTDLDDRLNVCKSTGLFNKVAVFLRSDAIEPIRARPENCWIGKGDE